MLVFGWVTAWCKHCKVSVFSCRFHWLGTVSLLLCCRKETMYETQITLPLLWCNKVVMLGLKMGVKPEVKLEVKL